MPVRQEWVDGPVLIRLIEEAGIDLRDLNKHWRDRISEWRRGSRSKLGSVEGWFDELGLSVLDIPDEAVHQSRRGVDVSDAEIFDAMRRGFTITRICDELALLGHPASRSYVGHRVKEMHGYLPRLRGREFADWLPTRKVVEGGQVARVFMTRQERDVLAAIGRLEYVELTRARRLLDRVDVPWLAIPARCWAEPGSERPQG